MKKCVFCFYLELNDLFGQPNITEENETNRKADLRKRGLEKNRKPGNSD